MRIFKSTFIAGVQCLKRLYWQVHKPELAAELDVSSEARIEQGGEVGLLARQLFPGGAEVEGSRGLDQAIRTTRELIANREVPAIFEGTLEHEGVLVRVDILQRGKENQWRLVEVWQAFKSEGLVICYRTAGNASYSLPEPRVTHGTPTDTQMRLRVCNGCGNPFRLKRSWQKQCSARCRQRAYVRRQAIRTAFYYGA